MSFKIGDYVEVLGNFTHFDEHGFVVGHGSLFGVINGYDEQHLFYHARLPAYHIAYDHDPDVVGSWTAPEYLRHACVLDGLARLAPKGEHRGKNAQQSG